MYEMIPGVKPTVQLQRFASELVRARREAGLTQDDVMRATRISRATLSRAENAQGRPHRRTLETLLDLYGTPPEERETLLVLFKIAGEEGPAWLSLYDNALPGEYPAYVQLEAEATMIQAWDAQVIPGLLQTNGYMHAIIQSGIPDFTEKEFSTRIQARMARQVLMYRDNPLLLDVILDVSALRRPIGGVATMTEQLHHLVRASERPNVTVRVLPESTGGHPGLAGPFRILSFNEARSAVYLEHIGGDMFIQDPGQIALFRVAFERLKTAALSDDESQQAIRSIAAEMESKSGSQ